MHYNARIFNPNKINLDNLLIYLFLFIFINILVCLKSYA